MGAAGWLWYQTERIACEIVPRSPVGFAVRLVTLEVPQCDPNDFIVALKGHEVRLGSSPSTTSAYRWLLSAGHVLLQGSRYVGGWFSRQGWTLNVSTIFRGHRDAHEFAYQNVKTAIYRHEEGMVIPVRSPDRGAA